MLGRLYRWLPWPADPPAPVAATPANDNAPPAIGAAPMTGPTIPSLSSATRDYARAVAAGTFGRIRPREHALLFVAMGPEIWAWQYARRLTGQPPWRAGPNADAGYERARAMREMMGDVATWERALAEHRAETERARLRRAPPPAPLVLPVTVQGAIEARRKAALDRATRRRDRGGDGGSGPVPVPNDAVGHPPLPKGPA